MSWYVVETGIQHLKKLTSAQQVESEYIDRSSLMLPVDLCHDDTTANFKKTLHTTGRTNNAPPSLDVLVSCDQSGRICLQYVNEKNTFIYSLLVRLDPSLLGQ